MSQQFTEQFGQEYQPRQQAAGQTGAQGQFQSQGGAAQGRSGQMTLEPQQVLGREFSQMAPPQISESVIALDRLETVAAYCHSRAMQQGNHQVSLIADGIEEIAHVQKELIVMENPLAQEMSRCSQQVLQPAIQQLQQYAQQPEVKELISETQQTMQQVPRTLQQSMSGGTGSHQAF